MAKVQITTQMPRLKKLNQRIKIEAKEKATNLTIRTKVQEVLRIIGIKTKTGKRKENQIMSKIMLQMKRKKRANLITYSEKNS